MKKLKQSYKNIIFDLDGTLTDSAPGIKKSALYALKKYNIVPTEDELTQMIGPPLKKSFQNIFGFSAEKTEEVIAHYREYFRDKGIFDNSLYPGVKEMIESLANEGRQLFVATTKATVFAKQVLEYFKIADYFSQVVGSNLDGSHSAKAEIIETIFSLTCGLLKEETVMIGDRKYDITGAKAHQLDSIAVLYGYGTLEELEAAKPTVIVGSLQELNTLLLN